MREDANRLNRWVTPELGGARFTSIGGAITGVGVDVLIIDDPHKDREDAESPAAREKVWNWYIGTALDRVETGGSVLICQTRWHPDDLTGRLLTHHAQDGWEVISLPALGFDQADGTRIGDDEGDALWPERWPREELLKKKRDDYEWRSKFQQSPVGRGGALFRGARFYTDLPVRYRVGKGCDLAYTAKTRADYSCAIVLLEHDDLYYVVDVRRQQCEAPDFAAVLAGLNVSHPTGGWHWFCSTTEKGVAQLMTDKGVHVEPVLATADKFVRAQPVATAWNEGRVLLPRDAPWLKSFVDELGIFTGVGDKHDDQVDALASAFESVRYRAEKPRIVPGDGSRWSADDRGFG
jgi:predicted phage terminase large subunit-like protein